MGISTVINPHPTKGLKAGKKNYVHMLNVDQTKAADRKAEKEARRRAINAKMKRSKKR